MDGMKTSGNTIDISIEKWAQEKERHLQVIPPEHREVINRILDAGRKAILNQQFDDSMKEITDDNSNN